MTEVQDMRTLDIYPTLLEMMRVKIPEGRGGFVQDIFDRPIVNAEKLFHTDKTQYRSVAVLQCFSPSWTSHSEARLHYPGPQRLHGGRARQNTEPGP